MRYFFIISLSFMMNVANGFSDSMNSKTGQIISENEETLGGGFKLVNRAIANPPEHWEGVGHFSFLYFHDRNLCQCGPGDFSISPSKRYAIFKDGSTGNLFLFDAQIAYAEKITQEYIGIPQTYTWNESKGSIIVEFYKESHNKSQEIQTLNIPLK